MTERADPVAPEMPTGDRLEVVDAAEVVDVTEVVTEVVDVTAGLELLDPRIEHRVVVEDRGPFTVSRCTGCGWESFARRSRRLARSEGRDHELLFASP